MEPTKVLITRDGEVKAVCESFDAAFARLLRIQPFSTHYAIRWGGWKYVPIYGATDVEFTRDVMRSEIFPPDSEEDYIWVEQGTRGVIAEEGYDMLSIHITISIDSDVSLTFPSDSYKLTPNS